MISVIIPVYNPGEKLRDCLDSVINQTYKDLQILLIDDGSTDNSGQICDEYAKKDNRIEVYHQKNSGPSVARNKGLDVAKGEYIAFVDSDDTIEPNMYEELFEVAEETKVEMVTSDAIMGGAYSKSNLPENRVIEKQEISNDILPMFTKSDTICVFEFKNKLISNELLTKNKIRFDENICFQEDLIFMINVYANLNSLYYLPKAFYNYVPVSSGLYSSYRKDGGEKFIYARKEQEKLINQYDIKIDKYHFNDAFIYNISFYIYRTFNYIKDKKEAKKLVDDVLSNDLVIKIATDFSKDAVSFERRISTAISKGQKGKAIRIIKFVYSGKKDKLLKIYSKLKNSS